MKKEIIEDLEIDPKFDIEQQAIINKKQYSQLINNQKPNNKSKPKSKPTTKSHKPAIITLSILAGLGLASAATFASLYVLQSANSTHTITFDLAGGHIEGYSQDTMAVPQNYTIGQLPTPKWDQHHTFSGWLKDGIYQHQDTLIAGNWKLTASWADVPPDPEYIPLTFVIDSQSSVVSGQLTTVVQANTIFSKIATPTVVKSNYHFLGWSFSKPTEGYQKIIDPDTKITSQFSTLYAFFAPNIETKPIITYFNNNYYYIANPEVLYTNNGQEFVNLKTTGSSPDEQTIKVSAFNYPLIINSQVTEIADNFLIAFSSFNSDVIFASNSTCHTIGNYFINLPKFSASVILPENLHNIGSHFLAYSSITQLTLPNNLLTIGDYFLVEAKKFNSSLIIPETVLSVGVHFLTDCDSLHFTKKQQNIIHIECDLDKFASSQFSFASGEATALLYTDGIAVVAKNQESITTKFPNSDQGMHRKILSVPIHYKHLSPHSEDDYILYLAYNQTWTEHSGGWSEVDTFSAEVRKDNPYGQDLLAAGKARFETGDEGGQYGVWYELTLNQEIVNFAYNLYIFIYHQW